MDERSGWHPRGSKNKKRIKARWKERKAREYIQGLNSKELQALRRVLVEMDEGLGIPDDVGGPGLTLWEEVRRRGRNWLNNVRKN